MEITYCQRCEAKCQVAPKPDSKARMLKRGSQAKGLCVNCAVHDWLRNTYPVNLIFATLSPEALRLEHIQQQFTGIMRTGIADANPDEINWEAIIANWDLPFKNKVKATAANPASQAVLDREPAERIRREKMLREGFANPVEQAKAKVDDFVNNEFLPFMRSGGKVEDIL